MKALLFFAALGLLTGWLGMRILLPKRTQHPTEKTESLRTVRSQLRSSETTTTGTYRERKQLGLQNHPYSPIRDHLVAMKLLQSLSHEELIVAIRSGEIIERDELQHAFMMLTEIDPETAYQLAVERNEGLDLHRVNSPHVGIGNSAELGIVYYKWSQTDPEGFLTFLSARPPSSSRSHQIDLLIHHWMRLSPAAVLNRVDELRELTKGYYHNDLAHHLVEDWMAKDSPAAEKWIEENLSPEEQDSMQDTLLSGKLKALGKTEEAFDFNLQHLDRPSLKHQLSRTVNMWVRTDPENALKRLATFPEDHPIWEHPDGIGLSSYLADSGGSRGIKAFLEIVKLVPEGTRREKFLSSVMYTDQVSRLPDHLAVIEHLDEGMVKTKMIIDYTEKMVRHDPVALTDWINDLPPSASRDQAVSKLVELVAKTDPEGAQEWAGTIVDPALREKMLTKAGK